MKNVWLQSYWQRYISICIFAELLDCSSVVGTIARASMTAKWRVFLVPYMLANHWNMLKFSQNSSWMQAAENDQHVQMLKMARLLPWSGRTLGVERVLRNACETLRNHVQDWTWHRWPWQNAMDFWRLNHPFSSWKMWKGDGHNGFFQIKICEKLVTTKTNNPYRCHALGVVTFWCQLCSWNIKVKVGLFLQFVIQGTHPDPMF